MNSFYSQEELEKIGFAHIGKNVLISRKASLYGVGSIKIGAHVRIDDFCILSGKITIGNHVHIAAFSGIYGGDTGVTLQDFSGLSSRCTIYAQTDDYTGSSLTNPTVPENFKTIYKSAVSIGRHVIIGTNSTILPGVCIDDGAAIGAHSLVNKSLEGWLVYTGVPAKAIKTRLKTLLEKERELLSSPRI